MASLTTHLSTPGRRARRVFSQRAQATVLSVALALGTALPAGVAVAQERDQGQEGIAAPEQPTQPDTTADPDFNPGSETALPFDIGEPDDADDNSSDTAPVDIEPLTDPDAPPAAVDDPNAVAPDALDDTDEAATPAEPPLPTPAPTQAPAPPPAATTTPPVVADQPTVAGRPAAGRAKRHGPRERQRDRARQRPAVRTTIPAAAPAPAAAPVATTAAELVKAAPTTEPSDHIQPGQRTHSVRRGESLWTIASDLLGADATDGEIAARTNRLYQLNRDRIGDDPNMLIAGTVLRLH